MPSPANILDPSLPEHIEKAADIIKSGGLIAFPTETVYGLGADAFNAAAVAKIFQVKKRPEFDPLIVHVSSFEQASLLWSGIPDVVSKLMKKFWPGPLTIVLPKKETVPDIVTAGLPSVAVRMPHHAAALDLIKASGTPIAAPSANLFGYTSPTTAQAVYEDLGESVDAILDGGRTEVGVESTVIKWEKDHFILLRPGGVTKEEIERFFPVQLPKPDAAQGEGLESPGLLAGHYAPWTPFALLEKPLSQSRAEWENYFKLFEKKDIAWPRIGYLGFGRYEDVPFFQITQSLSEKSDLVECAANLFQAMRKFDKMHLDLIVAEPVPEQALGLAVMDRMRRASKGKLGVAHHFEKFLSGHSHENRENND